MQQVVMPFSLLKYNKIKAFVKENAKKSCKIIAISKNHPISSVFEALECGVRIFGENRVQEALSKFEILKETNKDIELHLTGPLQTNKVKSALKIFDVFQTLDREKLALEFSKNMNLIKDKKFFIQINTGEEKSKSGVLLNDVNDFIKFCQKDLNLNIAGLMCIPPIKDDPEEHFVLLNQIAQKNKLFQLSMGMSNDYKKAVLCGATCIRVGTKIFGDRHAT